MFSRSARTIVFALWSILFIMLPLSCKVVQDGPGMRIGLSLSEQQDKASIKDFCSKVQVIPLEDKDGAYLNPSAMSGFRIYDDKIYFLDRAKHIIQIFDLSGKHLLTLDKHGRGPGEYILENELFINPVKKTLDLITETGIIYSYDIDNNYDFLSSLKISDKVGAVSYCILDPSGKGYYFYSPYSENNLGFLNLDDGTVRFFPYSVDHNMARSLYTPSASPFFVHDDNVFFLESFSGEVFELDNDAMSIKNYIYYDSGKYAFKRRGKNLRPSENIAQAFEAMKEESKSMASPYIRYREINNYILCELFFNEEWRTVIYNKNPGKAVSFKTTKEGLMFSVGEVWNDNMYLLMDPLFFNYYCNKDIDIFYNVPDTVSENQNYIILKYELTY